MAQTDHRRVRELFYEATKLPSSQWDLFLDKNCQDDDDSRRAVRRLLDHHVDDTLLSNLPKKPRDRKQRSGPKTIVSSDTLASFDSSITEKSSSSKAITGIVRSVTRSVTKKQYRLWLIALAMVMALSLAGFYVDRTLRRLTVQHNKELLTTLLEQQSTAIDIWLDAEFRFVETWARSEDLIAEVAQVDSIVLGKQPTAKEISAAGSQLRIVMNRMAGTKNSLRYAFWNREYREIAATKVDLPVLGNGATDFGAQVLSRVLQGERMLWLQTSKGFFTRGYVPDSVSSRPDAALLVPVYRENDPLPIAAMLVSGFGIQDRFQSIMDRASFTDSGETYAIDKDGILITESRFVPHLHASGLLPADKPHSARTLRVTDPGVNTLITDLPDTDPLTWPYTLSAGMVIRGGSGSNFDGYPDYKGVQVVGAWGWLEKYNFGIITEIDYETAFEAMTPMRQTYGGLLGLCGLAGFAGLARSVWLERARLKATVEKEIGPYSIERQIGEGGLAFVYLAHHSLLKRPTAIKQLKPEHLTAQNLLRFEREVQLASSLKHPNTIEIYDYGRTPKGNFYCAMEYVDGITLQTMLDIDGPQPPERVTWLLIEVCRSLREAHGAELTHRDIKPQNIMICNRANEYDCVKVLDFGLAREFDTEASRATDTRILIGTPMYIAPERIIDPTCIDPRSDIFSLGVLGHVLLVGREPHAGVDSLSILSNTMSSAPIHPSDATKTFIPELLDDLVWRCQARKPADRFQSIQEVLDKLCNIRFDAPWTQDRAKSWWETIEK